MSFEEGPIVEDLQELRALVHVPRQLLEEVPLGVKLGEEYQHQVPR